MANTTPPALASPAVPAHGPLTDNAGKSAMVFVRDQDSEGVIRQCLADLQLTNATIANGTVATATSTLREGPSPRLLIVDCQGLEDPVAGVRELANVCEPTTGVIVIGTVNDIRIYRALRDAGVVEYYYKPLVRSLVLQTCQSILSGANPEPAARTGKLVCVLGVRGGVGATTIATSTAWHLARVNKRQTAFVDLDLQYGDAALQFDVQPTAALKEALDHPERVDELFLERAVIHVDDRIGLLAGLHGLDDTVILREGAVQSLLQNVLRRYRYVFVDIPAALAPEMIRVVHMPGTLLLVSSASLACARDVARWRARIGPNSAERSTLHILNEAGAANGLPIEAFEKAAGATPDLIVPDSSDIAIASRLGVRGLQECRPLQRALVPLIRQLSGEEPAVARRPWPLSLFD